VSKDKEVKKPENKEEKSKSYEPNMAMKLAFEKAKKSCK